MLKVLRCGRCGATIDLHRPWSLNHLDFHAGWRFWSIKIRIYHVILLVVWHLNHFVGCLAFEYFRWLFGIWTCLALSSLQERCWRILHYWISNARISVLGTTVRLWAVCTAQTFFSCSLGILSSIRIVGTAGMHNFDRSFKSSGIFSQPDLPQGAEIPQGGRALGCARTCRRARVCARVAVPAWQYVGAAPQVGRRAPARPPSSTTPATGWSI